MKRFLIPMTILSLLVVSQFALGDDVADLKAAYEKKHQAANALDAETVVSMTYPGAVGYEYDLAFPQTTPMEKTKADRTQVLKMLYSNMEYLFIVPYNPQFRVEGNTGIQWGHFTVYYKEKGQQAHTIHGRGTSTWIKKDGKWYTLMYHESAIPQSN